MRYFSFLVSPFHAGGFRTKMTTRLALCPQVLLAVPAHGRRWRGCYWAWTYDGPFRWRGQSRECERHLVGVRSMFQVHDRRHVLGGAYGVYRFSSSGPWRECVLTSRMVTEEVYAQAPTRQESISTGCTHDLGGGWREGKGAHDWSP